MDRVFPPLKQDHPIITNDTPNQTCWICGKRFFAGQRIMLIPKETKEMTRSFTVEAKPVHATCRLRGVETNLGIIDRIKDGDASPYPVLTTDGKQWKLEDFGLIE